MGMVFAKTAKGQDEIAARSVGLGPRVRRVLILIDGRRSIEEVGKLVPGDELADTLRMLEEHGFIESASGDDNDATSTADTAMDAGDSSGSDGIFRELPSAPDPKQLEMARNFMINTLKTFCGQYGPVSLMSEIHAGRSHEELRTYFDRWYDAILDTRQGGQRASDLRAELLKVI